MTDNRLAEADRKVPRVVKCVNIVTSVKEDVFYLDEVC